MVREYIGARYVPKFMGTYNPTQIYEALCVVDNGLGTSYISKVPTPAGTPLTDTDYWAIYGASSGAIINLQNQIDAINTNIPLITGDLSQLTTTDQSNLVAAINEVDGDISSINSILDYRDPMQKKFWYIGDSFLYDPVGWGTAIDTMLGKTDSLATSDGGIGFNKVGQMYNKNIPDLINTITPDDDVTDVVVIAGVNDCTAENYNVASNVGATIANIRAKLPNAHIWFGFNGTYLKTGYSDYANRYGYVGDVEYNIKNGITGENVTYMRSVGYSMQWSSLCLDSAGVHLKNIGYNLMAKAAINHIYGGGDSTLTWWTSFHNLRFNMCALDNLTIEVEVVGGDLYNNSGSPLSIAANAFTDVYTNANCPILPRYTYQYAIPCNLDFIDTSNARFKESGCIILLTTDDKVRVFSPTAHANIKQICIASPATISKPIFVHQH